MVSVERQRHPAGGTRADPAIIGLVAGPKEQLLKMDLFLALSGVFMLGFASDQDKNLLSQKTKS